MVVRRGWAVGGGAPSGCGVRGQAHGRAASRGVGVGVGGRSGGDGVATVRPVAAGFGAGFRRGRAGAGFRGAVACGAGEGEGGDGAGPSMESLFAKELAKRGVEEAGATAGQTGRGVPPEGAGAGVPSFLPGLSARGRGSDPAETDRQLERSRLLNSEGLDGLPARAGALIGLGVNGLFLRFLPLALATALLVVACQAFFGEDFIHGGTSYRTPLVDPYELLAMDEASMTPFSRGADSDQYGIMAPPSPQSPEPGAAVLEGDA